MNKQTIDLVSDILSGKVSSVDLAAAGKSASQGEAFSAAVSAASGLQAMGAMVSKTVGKAAPPVFLASVADNIWSMRKDLGLDKDNPSETGGKLSNETALSALSTMAAGVALLAAGAGAVAAAPALAVGAAATAIVGSAALGVAALAATDGDTGIHDAVADLLDKAQALAAGMGGDLQKLFDQIGGAQGNGIDQFARAMEQNPNGLLPQRPGFFDQPDVNDPEVQRLIDELADAFNNAQTQVSPVILDLDGNGVQTVGLGAGVHFDHDANGFAQKSGWVGQGDGLLAANQAHWRQAA